MSDHHVFLQEVLAGLRQSQKTLPCKYFYDERGSELFEAICELEEYYLTRTELGIMQTHAGDMARRLGPEVFLVEYGSGKSRKTRVLLDAMEDPVVYVAIDISRETLMASADVIAKRYPELRVYPLCADYLAPVALPEVSQSVARRIVYFPGSTIGNFVPEQAARFLSRMAHQAGQGGGVLIGVDLKKDPAQLKAAYHDAQGITAAFNKNLLVRINRELGGNFREQGFCHEARWNAEEGRVEMHLVCREAGVVTVGAEEIRFEAGESIHTENAYKYEMREFEALAVGAGLVDRDSWTDPGRRFSVQYFEVDLLKRATTTRRR